jgi:CheY-like chemotaxis protein
MLLQQISSPRHTDPPQSKPATADQFHSHQPAHCPVLIVEDDAGLREMMAQLLSLAGFETHSVANGREALAYLRSAAAPGVILLDLMMPVMDGWTFRREQRNDPKLADVPVIVLSALDHARRADVGAIEFLKKPLDFDRLLQLVGQYCH